jgi:hypothetical protein
LPVPGDQLHTHIDIDKVVDVLVPLGNLFQRLLSQHLSDTLPTTNHWGLTIMQFYSQWTLPHD